MPVLIPAGAEFDAESTAQVLANLNSFGFDYVTRQKVQATHLTWYIVEQLPVIAAEGYDRRFGEKTARELVRDHALRLTYTANDMAPFARDLGFDGPPFIWDEEEAATCGRVSTRSTSISTGCPERIRATCSTPSP